jgi:hypothetical protein
MEKIIMKNLKIMFALMFVIGLLGISQAFACQFPGSENLKNVTASQTLLPKEVFKDVIFREETDQKSFSKRDLNGRYSSFAQATFFDPTQNRTTYATCVGVVTFDGRGRFTDREVHSYDGTIVRDQFIGTYRVNADGTGVMHFVGENESYDYDIVLSNEGKDVIFLVELPVPGLVSQGTLKKQ